MKNKIIELCSVDIIGYRQVLRCFGGTPPWPTILHIISTTINKDEIWLETTHVQHKRLNHACDNEDRFLLEAWKFNKPTDFLIPFNPIINMVGMELWALNSYNFDFISSLRNELLVQDH